MVHGELEGVGGSPIEDGAEVRASALFQIIVQHACRNSVKVRHGRGEKYRNRGRERTTHTWCLCSLSLSLEREYQRVIRIEVPVAFNFTQSRTSKTHVNAARSTRDSRLAQASSVGRCRNAADAQVAKRQGDPRPNAPPRGAKCAR